MAGIREIMLLITGGSMKFNDLVISEFPLISNSWSAGGTVVKRNGQEYFLQCAGDSSMIGMRDLQTGEPITGFIKTDIPVRIQDLSYDRFRDIVWASLGSGLFEYHLLDPDTWKTIRKIPRPPNSFGVFCDRDIEDVIWVSDQEVLRILEIGANGKQRGAINLGIKPRGIAKSVDYFWITEACEPGENGKLHRVDFSGRITDTFTLSALNHNAGGLSIDSAGHLWMVGGKGTGIYKLDISKVDGQVTPPVTPPAPDRRVPGAIELVRAIHNLTGTFLDKYDN